VRQEEEDIVSATRDSWFSCDVVSSHPGAGAGSKGPAVRRLKWRVRWVKNVVRQFGLFPQRAFGFERTHS